MKDAKKKLEEEIRKLEKELKQVLPAALKSRAAREAAVSLWELTPPQVSKS